MPNLHPMTIPICPWAVYSERWEGWAEFLGTKNTKSISEWVDIAESLAKENGGKLPNVRWLQGNGHNSLWSCMYRHPDAFQHIEQEKRQKTKHSLDRWVKEAEKLAVEYGGKLPNSGFLTRHGYKALYNMILKHPQKFRHIPMNKAQKDIKDRVREAEELAKSNGDRLPSTSWMLANGFQTLYRIMIRNKQHFRHIEKDSACKQNQDVAGTFKW